MAKKTYQLALYERALRIAAEDMYESEVIDTGMKDLLIGEGQEYADKEDWLESQMQEWLSRTIDKERRED